MAVTSTTLAGVNVWQLSGNVTDAELKTAWAGIITGNRYLLNRTIYIDSTCSLVNVRGTYYIDSQNLGVILHLSRNKADTVFRNWFFTQTVGLSVGARSNFVRFTNGSTITNSTVDGIDMVGGGMMYAVIGNPGGGDPRFLNEMMFGSLDGTLVTSAAWTEQELEPTSIGTIWRGLNMQKAAGYPILSNNSGTQRQVIYRSNFNTENATLRLIRPYYNNSVCYVSSTVRRQGGFVGPNLLDTFGSNGGCVIMVLNNWRDESWFGAARTNFGGANWNAGNRIIGGVMKKILVQPETLIRTYDSRSTTASQKSTFSETTSDFLTGTDSTTSDATTGRAQFVCVGAIATGGSIAITRYTGQKFTLQKFGYRVQVETPDMTFGDDDLSAFSPITMTEQAGIARTQAEITAATTVTSFQDLLEELHVLALNQVGAASYNAFGGGNLFTYEGGVLTTNFASVVIDPAAASKIAYNSATNTLTVKASVITSTTDVTEWRNASGTVTLSGSAQIQGVYTSSAGTSTVWEFQDIEVGSSLVIYDSSGVTKYFQQEVTSDGDYAYYIAPGVTGTYTWAIEKYGSQRQSGTFAANTGGLLFYVPIYIEDVGITETTKATVAAYTEIETPSKFYDRTAVFRLTEQGIKLGQMVARSGTALEIGNFSHLINKDAALVYSVTGSVITTKSTAYASDSRYQTEIANPPATITANTTEIITINLEDANGNSSVNIQASGVSTFEIWKITDATDPDDYDTGELLDTVGVGIYRFISADGFKMVIRDTTTNFRVVSEMEKGNYEAALFFGAAVQLAQAPQVIENGIKLDVLTIELAEVRAQTTTTQESVDALATDLSEVPAAVWSNPTRTLVEGVAETVWQSSTTAEAGQTFVNVDDFESLDIGELEAYIGKSLVFTDPMTGQSFTTPPLVSIYEAT
jgi:hypothetical protein